MSLHNLMQWMADTEWSVGLHESRYAYSIIESVHVWTLCLFVGFAVLLDLRLPIFDTGEARERKAREAYMAALNRLAGRAVNARSEARIVTAEKPPPWNGARPAGRLSPTRRSAAASARGC